MPAFTKRNITLAYRKLSLADLQIDALATSTGYAGRRPLPWLAYKCSQSKVPYSRVHHVTKSFGITSRSTYFCHSGQGLLQKKFATITTSSSKMKFLDCPQPYPKVS